MPRKTPADRAVLNTKLTQREVAARADAARSRWAGWTSLSAYERHALRARLGDLQLSGEGDALRALRLVDLLDQAEDAADLAAEVECATKAAVELRDDYEPITLAHDALEDPAGVVDVIGDLYTDGTPSKDDVIGALSTWAEGHLTAQKAALSAALADLTLAIRAHADRMEAFNGTKT